MPTDAFPAVYDVLGEYQVQRRGDIRAINRLNNNIGAYARRAMGWSLALPEAERKKINTRAERFVRQVMVDGSAPAGEEDRLYDAVAPRIDVFRQSMSPLIADRTQIEKEMRKLARGLSAWTGFAADVKGFGELGLAVIVGECGDLAKYSGPCKVYKRLGLAPFDGHSAKAWRIPKWRPRELTADEWIGLGYSPQRRAEIHSVVSDPLFRAQTVAARRAGGDHCNNDAQFLLVAPYRLIYDARRAHTAGTHPDWTKAHSHNDALRIMTKELILHLCHAFAPSGAAKAWHRQLD
jgi:hypothetical protein